MLSIRPTQNRLGLDRNTIKLCFPVLGCSEFVPPSYSVKGVTKNKDNAALQYTEEHQ